MRLSFYVITLTALVLSTSCKKKEETRVRLVAGVGSAAVEAPDTLETALAIINEGEATAEDIQIESISLAGAKLVTPASLPFAVSSIAPQASAALSAGFTDPSVKPDADYQVIIKGTYAENGKRHPFGLEETVHTPAASPGSGNALTGTAPVQTVDGAKFPPQEPCCEGEMNEGHRARLVPGGKERPVTPSQQSEIKPAPSGGGGGGAGSISFPTNAPVGISSSTTAEPSGASGGGVVFETENWFASYSTDGGATFNKLNPTTIFPTADGGFCCDQVVVYAASIDRFIWLLQYKQSKLPTDTTSNNGPNRYRIAYASPATVKSSKGTAWTYFDLTSPALIGTNNNTWLDYPDVSLGDNSYYLCADDVNNNNGHVVVRVSLSDIQNSSTINYSYTKPSDSVVAYGGHLSQNTRDEVFWGGHNTNKSFRVFNWPESSNTYNWRDIDIGTWASLGSGGTLTSTTPDKQDWLTKLTNFPGNAVLGIARSIEAPNIRQVNPNLVYFAWTGGIGNGFKQAQVQWIALDRSKDFALASQQQVWNASYAFAYPAFAVNSQNALGMSLEWGGGGNYENHVAGFWGDYVVYVTTSSDIGTTRFGDYVTIRVNTDDTTKFDAFGYGLNKPSSAGGSTKVDVHYIVFGR